MKFPNEYRAPHPLKYPHKTGDDYGFFMIPYLPRGKSEVVMMAVLANAATDWDHVSISLRNRCPTWDEMCYVKSLFWDKEETVVQYHPPESEYVNLAKNCLHLWKYNGGIIPRPPKIYVG